MIRGVKVRQPLEPRVMSGKNGGKAHQKLGTSQKCTSVINNDGDDDNKTTNNIGGMGNKGDPLAITEVRMPLI